MSKMVLLISSGIFHPSFLARRELRQALGQALGQPPGRALEGRDDCPVQHAASLEALPRLNMENYAAIVLYIHHKRISNAALNAFDAFISHGGGLLAVHSTTASFKTTRPYFQILGGRFTGHGPVEMMTVQPVSTENGPFQQMPAFQIRDELYLHELRPGIRVHFQVLHQGQAVPLVWTYQYGQGKVCYTCPGHTAASLRHPQVQEILRRGLAWVSA